MTEWGVIPSIRVRDMAEALAFYRGTLEFTLDSGGDRLESSGLRFTLDTAAKTWSFAGFGTELRFDHPQAMPTPKTDRRSLFARVGQSGKLTATSGP